METVRKDPLGSAWMVIAALGFTVMNLSVKAASTHFGFSSGELVFWRMLVSTLFLGIMAKAQGNTFSTPHWKTHLNRSVIGTLAMMCTFYSVMHLPLATGVTLNYTSSIWLAIFSFFILKERITLYTQAILVMGFIGVILLLNPSFQGGQEFAALVSLAGGAMSGWAYLQVRELSQLGEPSWRVVFYFCCVATAMSGILACINGWQLPTVQSLPYLFGLGAAGTLGQLAMTRAYQVGRKLTVASLSYLTVVFSTLLGIFWLGDSTSWHEIIGMLVIVCAGVLGSFAKGK